MSGKPAFIAMTVRQDESSVLVHIRRGDAPSHVVSSPIRVEDLLKGVEHSRV